MPCLRFFRQTNRPRSPSRSPPPWPGDVGRPRHRPPPRPGPARRAIGRLSRPVLGRARHGGGEAVARRCRSTTGRCTTFSDIVSRRNPVSGPTGARAIWSCSRSHGFRRYGPPRRSPSPPGKRGRRRRRQDRQEVLAVERVAAGGAAATEAQIVHVGRIGVRHASAKTAGGPPAGRSGGERARRPARPRFAGRRRGRRRGKPARERRRMPSRILPYPASPAFVYKANRDQEIAQAKLNLRDSQHSVFIDHRR